MPCSYCNSKSVNSISSGHITFSQQQGVTMSTSAATMTMPDMTVLASMSQPTEPDTAVTIAMVIL